MKVGLFLLSHVAFFCCFNFWGNKAQADGKKQQWPELPAFAILINFGTLLHKICFIMAPRITKIFLAFILLFGLVQVVSGQNTFRVLVTDSATGEKIAYATLMSVHGTGAQGDSLGIIEIKNVADGDQTFYVAYVGYKKKSFTVHFPLPTNEPYRASLSPAQITPTSYPLIFNHMGKQ